MKPLIQVRILDDRFLPKTVDGVEVPAEYELPKYETAGAAGIDLRAMITETIVLQPGETRLIPTGLSYYVEHHGLMMNLLPRSGQGHKRGLILGNTCGVIDSDYQGPLMVSMWNRGSKPQVIEVGERIAQALFTPVYQADFKVVDEFNDTTERGDGGFNSTGDK
ncbi:dUTPase [Vibrio phage K367 g2]